jgi:hypothetical protein
LRVILLLQKLQGTTGHSADPKVQGQDLAVAAVKKTRLLFARRHVRPQAEQKGALETNETKY